MGRINLTLKLHQVDEHTEVEDVREAIEDLIECEFPDYEIEVETVGHALVTCEECNNGDKYLRKQHRIED